jgi:phasin family protein
MPKTNATGNATAKPSFDPAAAFTAFPTYPMPNFDVDALAANQRRNVEALTEANKLVTDGAQAFAVRQAEILKGAVDAYADVMRGLMTVNDPKASVAKQAELAKDTIKTSNASLRELADIATKAQAKSIDVINKRVVESLDEFQAIAAQA